MAGLKQGKLVSVVGCSCFFKHKNWLTFREGNLFEAASSINCCGLPKFAFGRSRALVPEQSQVGI
jgi:hypothetical protein